MRSPVVDPASNSPSKHPSSKRSSVFQAEAALRPTSTPPAIVGRDAELATIAETLQPLASGGMPEHVFVHGPPGVGKTTCVSHVLEEFATDTSITTVLINCWQYNTRPALLAQLLIKLGYPAPRKGKPVDELLSKLREWLDKHRSVVIALDEFDQLDAATEIVYDLHQVSERAENDIGLVLIADDTCIQSELDPRSQSRLPCRSVEFEPYTADDLVAILTQRVEQAFRPGAVADEVVKQIAAHVAERSGDCRDAFEMLLRAGRQADQSGADTVTTDILDVVEQPRDQP